MRISQGKGIFLPEKGGNVPMGEPKEKTVTETTVRKKERNERTHTDRNYKDTVFRMLFREKRELLSLFNAVNGTDYKNPDELEVNTLENAIYMNMKNDISCVLDDRLNLYEHQATENPNMPLRDLFYAANLFCRGIPKNAVYSSKPIAIPEPRFIVFYNGDRPQPERRELYLSSLYSRKSGELNLELRVVQLNINPGFNEKLKKNCPSLLEYMLYVDKVRTYQKEMPLQEAVEVAIKECIREGVLVEFLEKNRKEVSEMTIFEYDEEAHMRMIREESYEDGLEEGTEKGIEKGKMLHQIQLILQKKAKGKPPEVIADELEEEEKRVCWILQIAGEIGTADSEAIYKKIIQNS